MQSKRAECIALLEARIASLDDAIAGFMDRRLQAAMVLDMIKSEVSSPRIDAVIDGLVRLYKETINDAQNS